VAIEMITPKQLNTALLADFTTLPAGTHERLHFKLAETMCAAAAPSTPGWQQRWERAVERFSLPPYHKPGGAGHGA
jgi:hypothetical protein